MSVAAYVAAAAVMALGACVQGAVGFGSNLIAAPLLVLIDPTFVPGPVSVASLALNVLIITTRSDGEHDRRIKWALVGLLPGTLLAGVLLSVLPERGLSLTFAAMVLVAVALSASGLSLAITSAHLSGAGFLSGFMGTVSGIGGPPIALVYQHEPASVLRGTLPRFFFLGGLISVATLMVVGRLGYDEIGPTLALLPGLFVGLSLSRPLARHLDKRTARPAVLGLSMVAAAAVLIRELL